MEVCHLATLGFYPFTKPVNPPHKLRLSNTTTSQSQEYGSDKGSRHHNRDGVDVRKDPVTKCAEHSGSNIGLGSPSGGFLIRIVAWPRLLAFDELSQTPRLVKAYIHAAKLERKHTR